MPDTFFPVFQPHSLLYPVHLQSTASLLKIPVRVRAGQIITMNQIFGVSEKCILMSPGSLCSSKVFVTKSSKTLLRKLSYPMLTKSALAYAGTTLGASELSQG